MSLLHESALQIRARSPFEKSLVKNMLTDQRVPRTHNRSRSVHSNSDRCAPSPEPLAHLKQSPPPKAPSGASRRRGATGAPMSSRGRKNWAVPNERDRIIHVGGPLGGIPVLHWWGGKHTVARADVTLVKRSARATATQELQTKFWKAQTRTQGFA